MIIGMVALLLAACSSSDDEGQRGRRLPVVLSIPASGFGGLTRAPGDPGNYEHFELPQYLWLYMVDDDDNSVDEPKPMKVVSKEEAKRLDNGWTKEKLGTDSIYTYAGELTVDLPAGYTGTARIYALLSAVPLENVTTITKNSSVETDVLDLTFDLPASLPVGYSSYGDVIRNIYSSPCNLYRDGAYYGTVKNYEDGQSPYVESFILYHVGAKLDVIWNVAEDQQTNVRLNRLNVTGLKKTGCKAFKPLENNATPTPTYKETFNIDVGAQWYGRHSFYVIPFNDNDNQYPVNLSLFINNNTTETANKAVTINAEYKSGTAANDIYTPWIVAPLQINSDLTE